MLLTAVELVNSLFCWSAWYSSVPLQRSSRTTESTIISQRLAQLIAGLQYTVIVAEVTVVCLRWEPRGLRSTATVGQGKGGASGTHAGTTHRSAAPLTRVRYTHNARTGVVHVDADIKQLAVVYTTRIQKAWPVNGLVSCDRRSGRSLQQ